LGIGWFVLSQVVAWFLRGRLSAQDRTVKIEQFAREEVKALADSQELFAGEHYDLAVMQAHRAVEARLRRVLLMRGASLPPGDPDALITAARRVGLVRESIVPLLEELRGHWRVAVGSVPLTREAGAAAMAATRDILAAIPVPEPSEPQGKGKSG
jgi:hypothetical protein